MARVQRSGGFTWIHGSLIAFVFLWLVSTVLLVLLYTDQTKMKDDTAQLRKDTRVLASPEEKNSLEYFRLASESGPTAIGLAETARAATAKLATGSPEDKAAAVQAKIGEFLNRIVDDKLVPTPAEFEGVDLLAAAGKLYDLYRDERSNREAADESVIKLTEANAALADLRKQHEAGFSDKVAEIQKTLDDIAATSDEYRKNRDDEVTKLGQRIDEIRTESAKQTQAFRTEKTQLDEQIAELQTRYSELRGKLGQLQITPEKLITARKGDAVVLTASPGDDVIYINLGKEDRIVMGMRFAVYSQHAGIPADGSSKAQIEVVTLYDRAAACRITRQETGTWVMPGDIVANPVYDRDRPLRFLIAGEFDTNGDGAIDSAGAEQMKTFIEKWGAEVLDDLTPQVDFVVVGTRPRLPHVGTDLSADDEARNAAAQQRIDAYDKIVKDAQSFSVPMMTQSILTRFLGFESDNLR